MSPVPPADFFISYTNANKTDKTWAEWIGHTLKAAGHTVLMQAWDMAPGSNFIVSMHDFATACERTILVLSSYSVTGKPFVEIEWAAALVSDPKGQRRKLVPVRVDDCLPGGLLAAIVYIDLFGVGEAEARARLLAGLHPPGPGSVAPPFPGPAVTTTSP